MHRFAFLFLLPAFALALAACGDEEIERAEIPVGAVFVSQVISRDLVLSDVPDSARVTLTFTTDSTLTLELPPNTCLFAIERLDLATWHIRREGSGCTEACCSDPLADEIVAVLAGGEFSLDEGTVTARDGRVAVVFD